MAQKKGILHMIYCWSEGVFKRWVICQTQLHSEVNHGCSQNLAGHFTVSKRWSSPLSTGLFRFISPLSLFQSVADIHVESSLHGIWNMSHFPPKPLCRCSSESIYTGNIWHPKDNGYVVFISYLGLYKQRCPSIVRHFVNIKLHAYAYIFSFLPINSKNLIMKMARKNGSCVSYCQQLGACHQTSRQLSTCKCLKREDTRGPKSSRGIQF